MNSGASQVSRRTWPETSRTLIKWMIPTLFTVCWYSERRRFRDSQGTFLVVQPRGGGCRGGVVTRGRYNLACRSGAWEKPVGKPTGHSFASQSIWLFRGERMDCGRFQVKWSCQSWNEPVKEQNSPRYIIQEKGALTSILADRSKQNVVNSLTQSKWSQNDRKS
jgi:hypothetical protein